MNNQSQTGIKLFIKNMVCPRCILVVKQVLKKMKLNPVCVELVGNSGIGKPVK